uniref:Zinc finger MYND domain-containing protein 15-like isoform X1 n=2 Tax=Crassostrea virginica TaxID=6565 RepID=A0A8B8E1B7_CRAVI|nr:zinc finger MYND domain-containing protein 15-like isoform X1 [Crassostrea virginica]
MEFHEGANTVCVKNLPVEDSVWFIETVQNDEEKSLRVVDKHFKDIGEWQHNVTVCLRPEDIFQCFVKSCLSPCKGSARRPRHVVLKGQLQEQFNENAFLCEKFHQLGVTFAGSQIDPSSNITRWRECHFCHMRAEQQLMFYCPLCCAVLYCSVECQRENTQGSTCQSHGFWCSKFLTYMKDTSTLSDFPFEFSQETSSADFDATRYRSFLKEKGVLGEGCWLREGLTSSDKVQSHRYGRYLDLENPYVLPVESCVLDEPISVDCQSSIVDWASYYKCRELDLSSPVAILLQWPLTVFFIIQNVLNGTEPGNEVNIDIVGVEKEVELVPVFKELGNLLPESKIDIHMFGRHLHPQVKEKTWSFGSVVVSVHNELYHKNVCAPQAQTPHLVIGFNAGIAAYSSWIPTIKKLKSMKVPTYFTDYCKSSIELSRLMLKDHCDVMTSDPILNPFRSPIRMTSSDHDLPWFSNAYILGLEYT